MHTAKFVSLAHLVIWSSVFASVGCAAQVGDEDHDQGAAPTAQTQEMLTGTVVTLNADGSSSVTTETFTRAQQLEWQHQREASLASNGEMDPPTQGTGTTKQVVVTTASCSNDNAIWLYDQPNRTGNMLCLVRFGAPDSVSLAYYGHPGGGSWGNNVRSYWGGFDQGFLFRHYGTDRGARPWCTGDWVAPFAAWAIGNYTPSTSTYYDWIALGANYVGFCNPT